MHPQFFNVPALPKRVTIIRAPPARPQPPPGRLEIVLVCTAAVMMLAMLRPLRRLTIPSPAASRKPVCKTACRRLAFLMRR